MMKVMRRDTMMEKGIVLQIVMTTHFTTTILVTLRQNTMMVITLDSAMAK
jgi:hypothetical protein